MEQSFWGEQLRKARLYRGMTITELAEQSQCPRQMLSAYESGKSQPSDKTLDHLIKVLNFPKTYFFEQPEKYSTGTTYFRSLLTTNKRYRAEQEVKLEFIAQIYSFLEDYIEFPQCNLPTFQCDSPEQAARVLRQHWKLGTRPIDNIITLVEDNGILVSSFHTTSDAVDAFSQKIEVRDCSTYIIGYSLNKTSATRIHFDIAHELGHICLHGWNQDLDSLTKEEFRELEDEANQFAAEFLLPSKEFRKDVSINPLSLPYYKKLKAKWKVSIAAMIRKAYTLGVITADNYQMLVCTMQKRGQRKEEPLDDTLMTAGPSLLRAAVLLLLQEEVFTPQSFMEELSSAYKFTIDPKEIEYLINLPTGTLSYGKVLPFKLKSK